MLSFTPPYYLIDGYTLLPDHADPGLFYVLPAVPRLAQTPDHQAAFSLVQFLGGGAGASKIAGGLLTLSTELSVPEEVLPTLRSQLAAKLPGESRDRLQLMPVLFDEGTVELIALGSSSQAPATPSTSSFKLQVLGSGKTSLGGSNTASFQLVLDATAAELIERCLDAPDLPVIVIYRMGLAGLRPSFQINIQADWRKVYQTLQNKVSANLYYVAADVDVMISKALEASNIKIDTTIFGTGEQARSSAERARKQLIDWVMQRLFEPVVDARTSTAASVSTAIQDGVWSLVRSVLPSVSYRLRAVDEQQLRLMSARMNETVAEKQEFVPQGTIGRFLNAYRLDRTGKPNPEWARLRSQLVQKVNLDGFPRLEVSVAAEDRFASDGVSQVQVELARSKPDRTLTNQQTLLFRTPQDRQDYLVNLLGETQANFSKPYQYRMEVSFNPSSSFGAHAPVRSDWQPATTAELFVEPRQLYTIREITIAVAPTFSFAEYASVTIELRDPAASESTSTDRIQLTPDLTSQVWRFRSFAPTLQPYEYRVTYHAATSDREDIESPWQKQIDDWLSIPDPLPTKRSLNLFVGLPWAEVQVAFVQIRYKDEANGIQFDEQIDLNPDTRYLRRDYAIAAKGSRRLAYRLTLFLTSGVLIEGGWRETEDERLMIDRRLVDRRLVTARAIGGSLKDNRLTEIRLKLQVREPSTQAVLNETELKWNSPELPPLTWDYLLGDPPIKTVYFSVLLIDINGFTNRTPWKSTETDLLVINLRTKTVHS